jgi:hypothetical protein
VRRRRILLGCAEKEWWILWMLKAALRGGGSLAAGVRSLGGGNFVWEGGEVSKKFVSEMDRGSKYKKNSKICTRGMLQAVRCNERPGL